MTYCIACSKLKMVDTMGGPNIACIAYPLSDLERVMRQHPGKCPSFKQEE